MCTAGFLLQTHQSQCSYWLLLGILHVYIAPDNPMTQVLCSLTAAMPIFSTRVYLANYVLYSLWLICSNRLVGHGGWELKCCVIHIPSAVTCTAWPSSTQHSIFYIYWGYWQWTLGGESSLDTIEVWNSVIQGDYIDKGYRLTLLGCWQ